MKVNRKKVYFGKMPKQDDGYVAGTPASRISMMWELTAEVWSLKNPADVKRRLQRNITKLIKP
jgi:hypothetical protein